MLYENIPDISSNELDMDYGIFLAPFISNQVAAQAFTCIIMLLVLLCLILNFCQIKYINKI